MSTNDDNLVNNIDLDGLVVGNSTLKQRQLTCVLNNGTIEEYTAIMLMAKLVRDNHFTIKELEEMTHLAGLVVTNANISKAALHLEVNRSTVSSKFQSALYKKLKGVMDDAIK